MPDIRLFRTHDTALIRDIVTHPSIYTRMADDYAPPREEYVPPSPDAAVFVAVEVDGAVKGVWVLVPQSHVLWEVHTALLPEIWGTTAKLAAPMLLDWVWQNTACQRLFTVVPQYARATRKFAMHAGMEECGVHERAYMKDGELQDLIIMGIGRTENSGTN